MTILLITLLPLVENLNASYDRIKTLQGEVVRCFASGDQSQTTIGKFYLKKPDKLCIKYAKPEQTIALNDTSLWIYLPAEKKAVKINYTKLSPLEKRLIGVESFLGLNPLKGLEEGFEFWAQDESTVLVQPKGGGKFISKIILEIDPQRSIILGTKIFDTNGLLATSTQYEDWQEINGAWFPMRVISNIYSGEKEIREEDKFRNIIINNEVDESRFNFTPPEGVEIISQ